MENETKRKWTVFFLIKSVSGSINNVIEMFNEIRSIELMPHVSIVIGISFLEEFKKGFEAGEPILKLSDSKEESFTTAFYYLKPNKEPQSKFKSRFSLILERPKFEITEQEDVEAYFEDIVFSRFKAKHYALITWEHGRAYGLFPGSAQQLSSTQVQIREDLVYQEKAQILTMEELASAITGAFGTNKVDLVIMMNCNTQFIDAGFALRKAINYLVAPETYMFLDGYNYPFIFEILFKEPKTTPKQLAKYAVRSFSEKVYSNHQQGIDRKNRTALFATNLRYYSFIAEQLDRIVDILIDQMPHVKKVINEAKELTMIEGNTYDFYSLLRYFQVEGIFSDDILPANLILSLKTLAVIEGHVGEDFLKPSKGIYIPSGFSIFLPNTLMQPNPQPGFDDFFKTEFYQTTKWKEFVQELVGS